jgi:hypothetical protein
MGSMECYVCKKIKKNKKKASYIQVANEAQKKEFKI